MNQVSYFFVVANDDSIKSLQFVLNIFLQGRFRLNLLGKRVDFSAECHLST